MKKILLMFVVVLSCSGSVFSQVDAKSKTVLKDFILGYDSMETLIKKGVDINPQNTYDENDDFIYVRLNEYSYAKDVNLVFIKYGKISGQNSLYCVRYYVYTDRQYNRYIKKLNESYHIINLNNEWRNKYLIIKYDLGDDGVTESFAHYDTKLLSKYPQFEDF